MVSLAEISPELRREIGDLARVLARRRGLIRLHTFLLLALILCCLSRVIPGVPDLPWWGLALALIPVLFLRQEPFSAQVRRFDQQGGFDNLLCAAVEVPASHPFADALTAQAAMQAVRYRGKSRKAVAKSAGSFRPLGPLYAVLAFLLFLLFYGPLFMPGPFVGEREQSARTELVGLQVKSSPTSARERPSAQGKKGNTDKRKVKRPAESEMEKIAFTAPPGKNGPMHRKKIQLTEAGGEVPLPPRPAEKSGNSSKRKQKTHSELFKRATERALGDGLLHQGEAWVAERMAEVLNR